MAQKPYIPPVGNLEGREYLNEFHRKTTLASFEEVKRMAQKTYTKEDFIAQVKRIHPNGRHKQRKF